MGQRPDALRQRRRGLGSAEPVVRHHPPHLEKEPVTPVILITGAATGVGNLAARHLAAGGHTVFASVRGVDGRNAEHAASLLDT